MSPQAQAAVQAQPKTAGASSITRNILQRAAVIPTITPVHSGILQRCSGGVECSECRANREKREKTMQRAAVNSTPVNAVLPIVHDVLGSPGQPLDGGTRAFMEPRFGYDFSQVRVHTDDKAAESARAVNALAYTVGRNVVFGEGMYAPETSAGKRLMAHELTHVVQQQAIGNSSSIQGKLGVGRSDDAHEQEAEVQAANVMEGREVNTVSTQGQPGIVRLQRKIDPVKELKGTGCEPPTTSPPGQLFARVHFGFDKDHVSGKEEAEIAKFVTGLGKGSVLSDIRVDGYASTVGDERYNLHLSCRRTKAIKKELAKELHIAEASIATFAHGETSEFSDKKLKKGPEENQLAIISANAGAAPVPKPSCDNPGVSRTVDLQPVIFKSSIADPSPTGVSWTRRIDTSNRIWSKVGVTFVARSPITKVDALNKSSGSNVAEFHRIRATQSGPGIEVFMVDNDLASPDLGGGGTVFGGSANAQVVISDRGTSDTLLAHELGHVLGLDHPNPPTVHSGDPGTILEPSGSNSSSNPTRNTMGNFSHITFPPATGSVCLHPDGPFSI